MNGVQFKDPLCSNVFRHCCNMLVAYTRDNRFEYPIFFFTKMFYTFSRFLRIHSGKARISAHVRNSILIRLAEAVLFPRRGHPVTIEVFQVFTLLVCRKLVVTIFYIKHVIFYIVFLCSWLYCMEARSKALGQVKVATWQDCVTVK